jgi:hypothetical protein
VAIIWGLACQVLCHGACSSPTRLLAAQLYNCSHQCQHVDARGAGMWCFAVIIPRWLCILKRPGAAAGIPQNSSCKQGRGATAAAVLLLVTSLLAVAGACGTVEQSSVLRSATDTDASVPAGPALIVGVHSVLLTLGCSCVNLLSVSEQRQRTRAALKTQLILTNHNIALGSTCCSSPSLLHWRVGAGRSPGRHLRG